MNCNKIIASILGTLFFLPLIASAAGAASSVFRDTSGFIRPLITTDYFLTTSVKASQFPYATSTTFTTAFLCLSGDLPCRSTWPTTATSIGTVSTSSQDTAGQIAVFGTTNGYPARLYSQATSTLTPSSPLTGSFVQIGTGGSVGIQAASASQNGYMAAVDWQLLHAATTTFGAPLSYSQSTNQVTCPTCSTATFGYPFVTGSFMGTTSAATTTSIHTVGIFTASSTAAASVFPYASTTGLTCATCFLTLGSALAGGGFQINNISDPTSNQDAATKLYVDNALNTTDFKDAVKYSSTAALPTVIYANGASGVGATLTGAAVGALSLDSNSPSAADRVLIKNQVDQTQNGIYTVTAVGSGIAVFQMTRATDFDQSSEIDAGDAAYVISGTINGGTTWVETTVGPITIGSGNIVFAQVAGPGSILGSAPIIVSGLTVSCPTCAVFSFANPTFSTSTISTSTSIWLKGGSFFSSSTVASQLPYASTTALTTVTASTTNLYVSGAPNALALMGVDGLLGKYGGASACSANNFVTTISAVGGTTCGTATISGISLGSNLAAHTVSGSITGTSYNGSAAVSDWALNMANANTWTALQTFKYASTTGISTNYASSTTYYGAGLDVGCSGSNFLQWTVGRFGCAAASGGSGAAFPFTPTTFGSQNVNATSTALWLQGLPLSLIASTTLISEWLQVGVADNGGNHIPYTMLQTSSSTNNFIQNTIHNTSAGSNASSNWITCNDQTTDCSTYYGEFGQNSSGYSQVSQNAENAGDSYITSSDGAFVFGTASSTNPLAQIRFVTGGLASSSIRMTIQPSGKTGFGTTTPWGLLSIASSTPDYYDPLFTIATSSGVWGQIFNVSATSSLLATSTFPEAGSRVSLGSPNSYTYPGQLDQFDVNGRINTMDWHYIDCYGGAVSASNNSICGNGFVVRQDNSGQVNTANTSGLLAFELQSSNSAVVVANSGIGYFFPSAGTPFVLGTSTPVMEAAARIKTPQNATSSLYIMGFTNTNSNGTSFEIDPTSGCFFEASSTANNWFAIARTAGLPGTMIDTGIASSTTPFGRGGFIRFRIETSSSFCDFYLETQTNSLTKVASIKTNIPRASDTLNAAMFFANIAAGLVKDWDINYIRLWFRQPIMQ